MREADARAEEHLGITIDLVRCYREAGDIARALDLGADALERVGALGLTGTDVHAELVSTVIGVYYERGDLVTAGRLAESALRDVDERGTARARAAVYWNASLVAEAADDVSAAVLLAERSLALYSDGDDERSLARLRVAYGWLLLRTSPPQPEKARDMLRTANRSLSDVGTATDIAYCETELARAALLLGDPQGALDHAALAHAQLSDEARLESAFVHLVRGAALLALERHDEAVADYRRASSILGSLDQARMAAGAWRELADAFSRLDLLQDAAMAYQQALSEMGVRGAPSRPMPGRPSANSGSGTTGGRTTTPSQTRRGGGAIVAPWRRRRPQTRTPPPTAAAERLRELTGIEQHDVALVLGSGWVPAADRSARRVAELAVTDLPGFAAAGGRRATPARIRSVRAGDQPGARLPRPHPPVRGARRRGGRPRRPDRGRRRRRGRGADQRLRRPARDTGRPAQPVLISDHINLTATLPDRGGRVRRPHRPLLPAAARSSAARSTRRWTRASTSQFPGPHYETPAEIGMVAHDRRRPGRHVHDARGDRGARGRRGGARLSLVTNLAAGITGEPLDHQEVLEAGNAAADPHGLAARPTS